MTETGTIDEIDRTLPISERFFSGGSTTLRGLETLKKPGPREAVIPLGEFRDQNKEVVSLISSRSPSVETRWRF